MKLDAGLAAAVGRAGELWRQVIRYSAWKLHGADACRPADQSGHVVQTATTHALCAQCSSVAIYRVITSNPAIIISYRAPAEEGESSNTGVTQLGLPKLAPHFVCRLSQEVPPFHIRVH